VATGAAWLKGRNSQGGREEQKHAYRKKKRKNRKTHLTHTGLLMEGVGVPIDRRYIICGKWRCHMRPVSQHNFASSRGRIKLCILILLAFVGLCEPASTSYAQIQNGSGPRISVHLSLPNRAFNAGEKIRAELRVSNRGDGPILIANNIAMVNGQASRLDLKLTDVHGNISPGTNWIADYAPIVQSDENAASKLLGSFVLLHAHTSLIFDFTIDKSLFEFLGRAGRYKLSASYASKGISYGHDDLGLSDALLSALPYPSWSGKIWTNEVFLNVVSADKPRK
jgi:hypothetical protein